MNEKYGCTVAIRNIRKAIAQKKLLSKVDIVEAIEYCKKELDDVKYDLFDQLKKSKNCEHSFSKSEYVYVLMANRKYIKTYIRNCNKCGYKEKYSQKLDSESKPEWCKGAYFRSGCQII